MSNFLHELMAKYAKMGKEEMHKEAIKVIFIDKPLKGDYSTVPEDYDFTAHHEEFEKWREGVFNESSKV